jgi:hypothetical protein
MPAFPLPLTSLIHEKLSIIMTFAFSRGPLETLMDRFMGEWKYLRKALFEVSQVRAEHACLELALFLRLLDDEEGLSAYLKETGEPDLGSYTRTDGSTAPLKLRQVANKIIHSAGLEWDFKDPSNPILISHPREAERWKRAEIDLVGLAGFCGRLMG